MSADEELEVLRRRAEVDRGDAAALRDFARALRMRGRVEESERALSGMWWEDCGHEEVCRGVRGWRRVASSPRLGALRSWCFSASGRFLAVFSAERARVRLSILRMEDGGLVFDRRGLRPRGLGGAFRGEELLVGMPGELWRWSGGEVVREPGEGEVLGACERGWLLRDGDAGELRLWPGELRVRTPRRLVEVWPVGDGGRMVARGWGRWYVVDWERRELERCVWSVAALDARRGVALVTGEGRVGVWELGAEREEVRWEEGLPAEFEAPSFSVEGRGLRVFEAGVPRRWEWGRGWHRRGAGIGLPGEVPRGALGEEGRSLGRGAWHPRGDVCAFQRGGDLQLRTTDGECLQAFGRLGFVGFAPRGERVVLVRGASLELWG